MRFFAIADLHLSQANPKPMDVFGAAWEGHPDLVFERWQETVTDDDVVLIAGDISWAMNLYDAMLDLEAIDTLPGKKIILRGNHDYWWAAIGKLRANLPPSMYALQNDALVLNDVVIAGARGWTCPASFDFKEQDQKIYQREVARLKLSLDAAKQLREQNKKLIVMMHYPPSNQKLEPSGFTSLLMEAQADAIVFGHIHGEKPDLPTPDLGDTAVHFVAADALKFYPKLVLDLDES